MINGIILNHYATNIDQEIPLNSKEMQLAMDKSSPNESWDLMCESVLHREGIDIQDGNWELEFLVIGGVKKVLH